MNPRTFARLEAEAWRRLRRNIMRFFDLGPDDDELLDLLTDTAHRLGLHAEMRARADFYVQQDI